MMKKRGQITIFIIIGIIILIILLTMIYFKSKTIEEKREAEVTKVTEQVPFQVQPLKQFAEQCAYETAKEALIKMQNGGYINISDTNLTKGKRLKEDDANPTESDVLVMSPGSSMKIPYWWYMKTDNKCTSNCIFDSNKPNLYASEGEPSIEGQITRYVEMNLDKCINNFQDFKKQGYTANATGKPKVKTTIAENEIMVYVEYPFEIKTPTTTLEMTTYRTTLPINMKKIYDLATELINTEQNYPYLETNTLNWIAGFSRLNENALPPLEGSDLDCGRTKFWIRTDVENNKIKPMLMSYVSLLQPEGIYNFRVYDIEDPLKMSLYSQTIIPFNDTDLTEGMEVSYNYAGWPIYLDITPNRGEMIEPLSVSNSIINFCLNMYKFAYDISYPVLVEVKDSEAFNGEGYSLQFAMETNIRDNEAMNQTNTYELKAELAPSVEETMLCNEEQKISANVTIETYDAKTSYPLADVLVEFCIPQIGGGCKETCTIGTTKMQNGKAVLNTKFPIAQGTLILSKGPEYHDFATVIGTELNKEKQVNAELEPFRTVNVEVKKKYMHKECSKDVDISVLKGGGAAGAGAVALTFGTVINPVWGLSLLARGVDVNEVCIWVFDPNQQGNNTESGEQTMISMKRTDPSLSGHTAFSYADYGENATVELIPGTYEVSGYVFSNKTLLIPKGQICGYEDWYDTFGLGTEECHDLPEIKLENFVTGQISLNNKTQYWNLSKAEIDSGKTLTIYVLSLKLENMTKHEDLKLLGELNKITKQFPTNFTPEIK